MSKRIPKKVREEAANACSAKASDWAVCDASLFSIDMYTDSPDAQRLASLAFWRVPTKSHGWCNERFRDEWAEADALLRSGWCPDE